MKVEIVAYYPHDHRKGSEVGTLHVKIFIGDVGIDLRGCSVKRKAYQYIISGPVKYGYDSRSGKIKGYPAVRFLDEIHHKLFAHNLITKGRDFVKNYYENEGKK